nr:MAG TPA: hypothetical protein [Caudoviricetes sp.]
MKTSNAAYSIYKKLLRRLNSCLFFIDINKLWCIVIYINKGDINK